ncbi:glycosyltransferase [Haloterrigena salifodinae]|uniref:glycosyltransferase n=1 Tax=Haloterrigena salifodinae TaxID=2675099 RepID=UPI0013DF873A|nr:glycosyltransferase [Haloterrigena salifodinae]
MGEGSIGLVSDRLYDSLDGDRFDIPDSPLPIFTETDRILRKTREVVKVASKKHDAIIFPRDVLLAGVPPQKFNAAICPIVHDLDHLSNPNNDIIYQITLSLMKRNLKKADLVLAISEKTKSDIVNQIGVPQSSICVFTQGVSAGNFYKDSSDPSIDVPDEYILYAGGLMPRKRPDILIETLKRLPEKELVVCGNQYSEEHTEIFSQMVEKEELTDKVHHFGRVPIADLRRLYSNASVLLHPAEKEGYGRTPIEAAACGTPVVLHESIPSAADIGSAAYTFSIHDPKKVASLVQSASGCSTDYEPITWEESAKEVEQLIEKHATT